MASYDISTPIVSSMAVFPGDPPVRVKRTRSTDRGDPYNVSEIQFGSHTGTHVDPPLHFLNEGAPIDRIDLSALNGPCFVHRVPDRVALIGPSHLEGVPPATTRLLLRTRNSTRWAAGEQFFPDYVGVGPDGARALIRRGVRLVGSDSLSVEPDQGGAFPVHRALLGAGVLILEGLRLAGVPSGSYQLHCLPLRISGGDGGPARAILTKP